MKNVTNRYLDMINAFSSDFILAKDDMESIPIWKLQELIDNKDEKLLKDIELLEELSYQLHYGKIKIIEQ